MATVANRRLLGNKLGLTINGKDYWADVASWELAPSDSDKDVLTFADAAGGSTSKWTLKIKAIQSLATASFWSLVWDSAGQELTVTLAPEGNKTASTTSPHFTCKATVKAKPSLGVEAGEEKGALFEVEWACTEPKKLTTGSTLGTGSQADS